MPDLPRYLVIAPEHPDLTHLPDEAAAIAEALTAKLLAGDVRLRTVLDYVSGRQGETLRGVWVCSHADSEGIWLWNGDVMSAFALAGMLNTTGLPWVAVNTCYSAEWIDIVQRGAPVDAIATIRDVPDKSAWLHGRLIAQNYARSGNLRSALYQAAPGGATLYRFFPAPTDLVRSRPRVNESHVEQRLLRVEERLARMEQETVRLERAISRLERVAERLGVTLYGDTESQQYGLVRWFRWGSAGTITNTVMLLIIAWRLFFGG